LDKEFTENKAEEKRWEYRNIKVKPATYRRLRYYQNLMELQSFEKGEEVRYTMDTVISALLDLLESAKIKIRPTKQAPS
jgi:hypothetical protein